MNIDKIKKGLECCLKPTINYCANCPYDNKKLFDCDIDQMHQDALNLINEQENQIAALRREVEKKNDQTRTY